MAKNSIFDPTKDGVKADNSGYSSNQIDTLIEESAAAVIDDDAAGDDTVYSSAKIYSLLPEDTATGAEVTITDACPDLPIVAGTFNIDANLDGVTEVTISNDTEDVTVNLAEPCYGGNVKTDGTVTNTYKKVKGSDLTWTMWSDDPTKHIFYCVVNEKVNNRENTLLSSDYTVIQNATGVTAASQYLTDGTCCASKNTSRPFIYVRKDDCSDETTFNEAISNTIFVFELQIMEAGTSIDPFTIKTLPDAGSTNIISCDTGDSTITYKKLTTLS